MYHWENRHGFPFDAYIFIEELLKYEGRMRLCELEDKEVINVVDGRSLGCVTDLEFDPECGHIEALIVPGPGKCFGLFGREYELVIPWKCICQIGPDVVLVQIDVDKCKH